MKNILVAIELDENSQKLVDIAGSLAEKYNSFVCIVHVADPEPIYVGNSVGRVYIREFRAQELRREHRLIQQFAEQLKVKGLNADGLLITGATVELMLKEMEKLETDLLIIGHHKHSFLYKLFVGTTDIAIVNRSKVPVLVVPL